MPRKPDPDLEDRILKAAQMLWKRGGEESLTMRAVARAARTNTPAVYRRFKDRHELVHALLLVTVKRIRERLEAAKTIEDMMEGYVDLALEQPREYQLFYNYARELSPRKGSGRPKPIRESRPNFGLLEQRLAERLGGSPHDHSRLALALWALSHGTTTMLIAQAVPEGHEEELRRATRASVTALLENAGKFPEGN